MPTGSGQSPLYAYISKRECGGRTSWLLEDATFEKMGAIMADNGCRIFGMYDDLTTFLTQINLYKGRGLADSHELGLFLQLYNGHPWTRYHIYSKRGFIQQCHAHACDPILHVYMLYHCLVIANFCMDSTNLTLGGFT